MIFKHMGIALMLTLSICLLTACGPKEENTATDNVDSSITFDEMMDKTNSNEFKEKYGNKLPWGNVSDETKNKPNT